MALETGTYISDFVLTNPTGADDRSTADDHIRLIKNLLVTTFPNITGATTPTHTELNKLTGTNMTTAQLNYLVGVTSAIQTQLNAKVDDGANSTITSLTGLTTDLAVVHGGTGSSSASGARSNLGLLALAIRNTVGAAQIDANAVGQSEVAVGAIGQDQLNSTTAAQSGSIEGFTSVSLTGGNYTMMHTLRQTEGTPSSGRKLTLVGSTNASARIGIWGQEEYADPTNYTVDSRYVQASPPYNLGDGDIPLFCYALVADVTGLILGTSFAKDPHWAYHGRHNITPDRVDKITGKKYKTVPMFVAEGFDFKTTIEGGNPGLRRAALNKLRNKELEEIELTEAYKNQDMNTAAHPWIDDDLTGKTVVLLDPVSPMVLDLYELHKQSEYGTDMLVTSDLPSLLHNDYIRLGNAPLQRTTPAGLIIVAPRWKNTQ